MSCRIVWFLAQGASHSPYFTAYRVTRPYNSEFRAIEIQQRQLWNPEDSTAANRPFERAPSWVRLG
jgi:hypothetical protein